MSPVPALGVGLLALLGLVLAAGGVRVALGRGSAGGPRRSALTGTLLALGVASLLAAGSGFRHFGGQTNFAPEQPDEYVCAAWYTEIGSRAGRWEDAVTPAPACRRAAEAAIPAVVGESVLVGGAAGVLGAGLVMLLGRRRVQRADGRLIVTSN